MIKIVILILVSLCVVGIGYIFSNNYRKKICVFSDATKFCEILELKIKLNKQSIIDIINKCKDDFSSEFISMINILTNKHGSDNISFLDNQEERLFADFFQSLGRQDVDGEIHNIRTYKEMFNSKLNFLIANRSNGQLGIKLGMIFGLIIFIIFI